MRINKINEAMAVETLPFASDKAVHKLVNANAGKIAGAVVGIVLQPVVWAVKREMPGKAEYALYSMGVIAGLMAPTGVGLIISGMSIAKAALDQRTQDELMVVRKSEPAVVRDFVHPVTESDNWFGGNPRHVAFELASQGATCWRHTNGLWVYMKAKTSGTIDRANGKGVPRAKNQTVQKLVYNPVVWTELYTPALPLKRKGKGLLVRYARQ